MSIKFDSQYWILEGRNGDDHESETGAEKIFVFSSIFWALLGLHGKMEDAMDKLLLDEVKLEELGPALRQKLKG